MNEQQAIEILKEMYDRHDLPQDCLQALSKGIAALKTERMARTAIGKVLIQISSLGANYAALTTLYLSRLDNTWNSHRNLLISAAM